MYMLCIIVLKDATGVVASLSDTIQQANQALLDVARDTLLHREPTLLTPRSKIDDTTDTTAPTNTTTTTATATDRPSNTAATTDNHTNQSSSNSNISGSKAIRNSLPYRSPMDSVRAIAFWGRFRTGTRVRGLTDILI